MDNRINEIRRQISALRAKMALVEVAIRDQVNHDQDCAEAACQLLAMRAELAELIGRWKAAGGSERLPTVRERLSQPAAVAKRVLRGTAERRKKSRTK